MEWCLSWDHLQTLLFLCFWTGWSLYAISEYQSPQGMKNRNGRIWKLCVLSWGTPFPFRFTLTYLFYFRSASGSFQVQRDQMSGVISRHSCLMSWLKSRVGNLLLAWQVFEGFPYSRQENAGLYLKIDHDHFLPHSYNFTNHPIIGRVQSQTLTATLSKPQLITYCFSSFHLSFSYCRTFSSVSCIPVPFFSTQKNNKSNTLIIFRRLH
jgi:hypothetical protein